MNYDALLLAIAMVETGNDPTRVGSRMEISEYQFKPSTWGQHCPLPYQTFRPEDRRTVARRVAKLHLDHLNSKMPRHIQDHPFWLAAAWYGGTRRCNDARWFNEWLPKRMKSYAERVENLFKENVKAQERTNAKPDTTREKPFAPRRFRRNHKRITTLADAEKEKAA